MAKKDFKDYEGIESLGSSMGKRAYVEVSSETKESETNNSIDFAFEQLFVSNLGKRIIAELRTNKKIVSSMNELEKICDEEEYNALDRQMILEGAYTGCVVSALNRRGDPASNLQTYVKGIKDTIKRNLFSVVVKTYVEEVYKQSFV